MANLRVTTCGWKHVPAVAELVADAMPPGLAAWLVPDTVNRRPTLVAHLTDYLHHLILHGTMHVLKHRQAASVWVHRHRPIPPFTPVAASDATSTRIHALYSVIEAAHPPEPHHHLAILAVHPTARRTGRATTLLTHHHLELNRLAMPASVHLTDPTTRALLAPHGYQDRPALRLPDGPNLYVMWRAPQ